MKTGVKEARDRLVEAYGNLEDVRIVVATLNELDEFYRAVGLGEGCKCDPIGSGEEWCVGTCIERNRVDGYAKECDYVEQVLGKVLGYPWYKDDPENWPDATEKDGVCVGDHTAGSLALEAADRITVLSDAMKQTAVSHGWTPEAWESFQKDMMNISED